MIRVSHLSKRFGSTLAVNDVSFDIPQGQVVGFLGPNGAGKTTTMRLLTGYLPPDDGEAEIMGHGVLENSLAVRKKLGYLPESNPLPDDIEVTDYLHYIGKLRGLHNSAQRLDRVKTVLKLTSLNSMAGKKLNELSKGYRQRVGLAQAIIHDPDVLILDEPTSGLDPNQVQEVRNLILDLKKQKTLILSTHILSEVQHTCDRVLIINKGSIVADGSPQSIGGAVQNLNRLFVSLKGPQDSVEGELSKLDGVLRLVPQAEGEGGGFLLESEATQDLREEVFKLAVKKKWTILELQQKKLSLEEVFQTLTGKGANGKHT